MIQFNLLPAVKIEYLRTKKLKRKIIIFASISIATSALISLSLYSVVFIAQPQRLKSLEKSIGQISSEVKSTKDLNKILTIQNQLSKIDGLHSDKPSIMRLFTYVTQITPSLISIQTINVMYESPKIEVSGQAPTVEEVNKYIDTLKFTTIDYGDGGDNSKKAFSQVVLSSYSINEKGAGFRVTFNYEPDIFKSDKEKLKLVVPNITSTRSATERPSDLFKVNETPTGEVPQNE